MDFPIILVALGVCLGLGGWQLGVTLRENREKRDKYAAALAAAAKNHKPLLVAGGPWGISHRRRWFIGRPAHGNGDVCLDIDRRAFEGHPCAVIADVAHIPFTDKCFGAAFACHILEHLHSVEDAKQALRELNRVAEAVFVVSPSRQSVAGWVIPDHHLWVWQEGQTTYLRQRGSSPGKKREEYP